MYGNYSKMIHGICAFVYAWVRSPASYHITRLLWICPAVLLLNDRVFSQSVRPSLEIGVLTTPVKINVAGTTTVYYELVLTSFSNDTIQLTEIGVRFNDSTFAASYNETDLQQRYRPLGVDGKGTRLNPRDKGVVYIELALPGGQVVTGLSHTVRYVVSGAVIKKAISPVLKVMLSENSLVIGPPVGTGNWAAVYDPSWERGHRRVIYTRDGNARIPGRFAIDFIKLDEQGKYARGDENLVSNWYGYNSEVLAVADGLVLSVRNDFIESKTISDHPHYTAEKATGNYISIRLDDGLVAFYEHLRPNSIAVKPGDRVKKGQVIASLGFTGQTTGPHLHFHVADQNFPLGAEGRPFAFDYYELQGRYEDFSSFGKLRWNTKRKEKHVRQRPAPNSVIRFKPEA